MPPTPTVEQQIAALYKQQRTNRQELANQGKILEEMKAVLQTSIDSPKWIEEIAGKRVPFIAQIEITIAANSTSRVEGNYPVSQDGPFVCTGAAMFWRRTSGAYTGWWAPATTVSMKMAPLSQELGFDHLFDTPVIHSFNVELSDSASDRQWQNIAFASALFSPESGYMYMWPVQYLFPTNTIAKVYVTPTVAQSVSGVVAVLLLGYKIAQGAGYQP